MSGSTQFALPFRRGSTYKDGSNMTLASDTAESILGTVYETRDSLFRPLLLRVVRADAALTNIGGKCVEYTSALLGTNASEVANTAGAIVSPVDDAYASTFDVDQYDLFYVVEKGFVDVLMQSDVDINDPVAVYTNGGVAEATADQYVIGMAQEDYVDATTASRIYVNGDLYHGDPST